MPSPDYYANFIESYAAGATAGFVPPVFGNTGAATANTEHIVRGSVAIAVGSGVNGASAVASLTGSAAFSSAATWTLVATYNTAGSTLPAGWLIPIIFATRNSGAAFTAFVYNYNLANTTGTGTIVADFIAVGY